MERRDLQLLAPPNANGTRLVTNGNGTHELDKTAIDSSLFADAKIDAALDKPRVQALTPRRHGAFKRWKRTVQIMRVLGGLGFYLFLENYDARRKYMLRTSAKLKEEARAYGRIARFQEWSRDVDRRALDKIILLARRLTFGNEEAKEARLEKQAAWLNRGLVSLGPTFIKIGQSLGTRADLLPLAYVKELATLQDKVPAFPTSIAYQIIERELGKSISELYAEIDSEPIAAASLGQVYRARLHTGEEVAVKVQRPDLEESISFDLEILAGLTARMARVPSIAENADWEGMLREFAATIREEMNYRQEGINADRFARNFKDWTNVFVPRIHWSHSSEKVLTMTFIRGTKVTDIANLKLRRISPVKVNRLLIRTYLKQLFEDGFFHADPHPGNLLVMDDGRLAFFDFGMTGRITPQLQSKMIDAFFHVIEKDSHGIAQDLFNLEFLKPGYDGTTVRPVIERMFELYFNLKLGEVNFKDLTYDLADIMYDYPFRLPANFTYIIRALMTLEGIGIATDPEFNFFETARPFAKDFMLRRESKTIRNAVVNSILKRDDAPKVEWNKIWKLTKMAARTYFGKNGDKSTP